MAESDTVEEISSRLSSAIPSLESVSKYEFRENQEEINSLLPRQLTQVATSSIGTSLPALPLMLSVGMSDASKQVTVTGSLPPVLPLIQQSGLQTLSHLLSSPALNLESSQSYTSTARQLPVIFQSEGQSFTHSADQLSVSSQIESFGQTRLPTTKSDTGKFISSSRHLPDTSHESNIMSSSSQGSVSLSDTDLHNSILDASIHSSSQNLTSVQMSDNRVTRSDIGQRNNLSGTQNQILSGLSVQEALAAHLGSTDLSRADLSQHLGELVANSTYLRQQTSNQDMHSNHYITSHLPHSTELVASGHISNHQDVAGIATRPDTDNTETAQLSNDKLQNQISAVDASSLAAVGYSSQDYLGIQNQLSSYLSEEPASHEASVMEANLSNQIEALTNAIKENESGLVGVTGKDLPVSSSSPSQMLIDNIMVLKNSLSSAAQVSSGGIADNSLQMVISVSAVPSSFLSFCLDCHSGVSEQCSMHNSKEPSYVGDTPILSRARASLPQCLHFKQSEASKCQGITGVWATQRIPSGVKFGPLVGEVQTQALRGQSIPDTLPNYKVFYHDKVEEICANNEDSSNWLMFLQPARTEETQNMAAHQVGNHVYFYSITEIYPSQELLFWYTKDYAAYLGYPVKPNPKKMRECTVCGKIFTGRRFLQEHQRITHHQVVKRKYPCGMCAMGFSSAAKLKIHMNSHLGMKPHGCSYCGKGFTDQSNLRKHLAIHTATKKYSCDKCSKHFRQKAHLQTHMLIHSGEKNLKCTFCDKRFTRESDRKQHMYQHTKEKTYPCSECNKMFFKLQNFKRHLLTHGGEKNHVCSKCQKCFYTKYHLQRHTKSCKGGKATKTEIHLNRHEKCLNLAEVENELKGGPLPVRPVGKNLK